MSTKIDIKNKQEAKELIRWQKLSKQTISGGLFIIIIAVLCLVRGLDEFATSAPGSLQTSIVTEFFVKTKGMDFAAGLSQLSLVTTPLLLLAVLATLYLTLADRFGRKLILTISVFGMALGMFTCFLSTNFTVHVIGRALLTFFIATDVHQIYLMEIAPNNKRAILLSINSFFGYLSMMLVSVARDAYTVNGELVWRNVFLIPAVLGLVLTALLIIFGKETKVFLDQRIAYLSTPHAEKGTEAGIKKEKAQSGGLGRSFKFIFAHRQPRMNMFATIFQLIAIMAFYGYYESIMTTSGMTTNQVTQALLVYPITAAVFSIFAGFIADKFGRKPAAILYAALSFIGLIAFILGARAHLNPYIVGLLYGLELGCFWSFGDQLGLVFKEAVPTEIRATATAARGLISVVVSLISGIVISILVKSVNLSTLCLVWGAVTVGISIIMFALTVKETKGVDLENVVSD
jgi:MFS family permease